jgi:RND superfamily putative drug exporter
VNAFVRRLGDASARRPGRAVAAWALLAAVVVALSSAFSGAFLDDFTAPGSDSAAANELLEQRFPAATGGAAVAVFAADDGLAAHRRDVDAALARLADVEHVAG